MELRHQVEIHAVTGRIVECPIDEMNKPRGRKQAALRIPPTHAEIRTLFTGWRQAGLGPLPCPSSRGGPRLERWGPRRRHAGTELSALRALDLSCDRTADVLDQMGILLDDRRPSFEDWLDGKLDAITPGIAREVETWLRSLRDGGPRARPRNISTVWHYANALRPILLQWSTPNGHPPTHAPTGHELGQ